MFIDDSLMQTSAFWGIVVLSIASFIAGYIDAIAGGAGLVLIPAFMLAGFTPQFALGQEKLVSTIGTFAAIKNFAKGGHIVLKVLPTGILAALFGSYLGAKIILLLSAQMVSFIIMALLPFGLFIAIFKKLLKPRQSRQNTGLIASFITCFVVGFYDGFFGPGTGSLFIIALSFLNGLSLLESSGTSKILNLSSNIGAFIAFAMAGEMAFLLGIPMIISSVVANHIASLHAIKTDGALVQKVLYAVVLLMLCTLVYQAIQGF
ncbi:TSUP family transporter [Campylobacter sp. 19-13652]|uniref:TSUP family transporter n=1 Tax=Campylobacter sp. 19-13652 TaxID=2840180 RepID=UPI001C7803A9|nr:TSUP family transporter [Campylobacter sp. 19-13652]BCX78580.1 membrane protein [Campylobacter sp. 19-13652]